MALSPISTYQNQDNSLVQLLKGGSGEISSIMDRAIQVGRDISNKQLAQEQDLLAIRKNETALSQRRAENLQQDNEDAMRFARNAYEFDTKFGADTAFREQQAQRQGEQDAFSNQQSEARLGLAQNADRRAEADQGFQEKKFNAEEEARKRQIGFYKQEYGPKSAPPQDPNFVGPPAPFDPYAETRNMNDSDLNAQRTRDEAAMRSAPDEQSRSLVADRIGRAEAEQNRRKVENPPEKKLTDVQLADIARKEEDQQLQRRGVAATESKNALGVLDDEWKSTIKSSSAFSNPYYKAGDDALTDDKGNFTQKATEADKKRITEGSKWMDNQSDAELKSALSHKRDEWISLGAAKTAEEKQARGEAWDKAQEIKKRRDVLTGQSPFPAPDAGPQAPQRKQLTSAARADILNRAGGDPIKARQLAIDEGY